MKTFRRRLLFLSLTGIFVCLFPAMGQATVIYDREALEATRRIAILPPFFIDSVAANSSNDKIADSSDIVAANAAANAGGKVIDHETKRAATQQQTSAKALKPSTLQAHLTLMQTMQSTLPVFLAESGRFTIVPISVTQKTLHSLHWQARDLFLPDETKHNPRFLVPDTKRVQQLARRMHVDAIFLGTMREPASIAEGFRLPYEIWRVDPLHMSARHKLAHVLSPRVQASLVTNEGVLAWQDEQMADHPRTLPHTQRTLLIDWEEATEQAAQQLAGSLISSANNTFNIMKSRSNNRGKGRSRRTD